MRVRLTASFFVITFRFTYTYSLAKLDMKLWLNSRRNLYNHLLKSGSTDPEHLKEGGMYLLAIWLFYSHLQHCKLIRAHSRSCDWPRTAATTGVGIDAVSRGSKRRKVEYIAGKVPQLWMLLKALTIVYSRGSNHTRWGIMRPFRLYLPRASKPRLPEAETDSFFNWVYSGRFCWRYYYLLCRNKPSGQTPLQYPLSRLDVLVSWSPCIEDGGPLV